MHLIKKFPFIQNKYPVKGIVIHEKSWKQRQTEKNKSSQAGQMGFHGKIVPPVPFRDRNDFYITVPRFKNAMDSIILNLKNRDCRFEDTSDNEQYKPQLEVLEQWAIDIRIKKWISTIVLNWGIHGLNVISPDDWVPMQNEAITGIERDDGGDVTVIWQATKGFEKPIPIGNFIWLPYQELDRRAFPVGMFESLMTEFEDIDGLVGRPLLQLYRQMIQDITKIHHKYASPRVIYTFPGVDPKVIDEDIAPAIEAMKGGDRIAINVSPEGEVQLIQETVDGKARFSESVEKVTEDLDAGLQSSANRAITKPSAMADAREAGSQDDDRILGVMDDIRQFINLEVIPRITGLKPGTIEFKWGAKDSVELQYPPALKDALHDGLVSPEQALKILEDDFDWKVPKPEDVSGMIAQNPIPLPGGGSMDGPPQFPLQGDRGNITPTKTKKKEVVDNALELERMKSKMLKQEMRELLYHFKRGQGNNL